MKACLHVPRSYRQQGAVLFICLIILLVITMLGITASQTTILEEKMAGNLSTYNMAFEGAETALRACESRLRVALTLPRPSDPTSNPWAWLLDGPNPNFSTPGFNPDNNPPWWVLRDVAWWQNNGGGQGGGGTSRSYNVPNMQQSLCVIEYLGWQSEPINVGRGYGSNQQVMNYYRITARSSTANNNNIVVILQSVFDQVWTQLKK